MFIVSLLIHAFILLQSLDATDITSLMSAKELTVNGLLLVAIIMLWRKMTAAEEKIEALRKEKDADNQKFIDLLITTTKILDGNTKMLERVEKVLDK